MNHLKKCLHCQNEYDYVSHGYRTLCKKCQMSITKHPQMETKFGFTVDSELKDLIEKLNERKIRTINSCQEQSDGMVWIQLYSETDMLVLLRYASAVSEEFETFVINGKWTVDFTFHSNSVIPMYSWKFPVHDKDYVIKNLLSVL